ncbi:MAG: ATP-binding protein, partial [Leucothrix sp.]
TRLFLKIAGLLLVTNLLVLLVGYLIVQWLEQERVLISPQHAPDIIAERVVKAWEDNSIDALSKTLAQHGTLIAILDENRNILFAMPQIRHRLERRGSRRPFPRHSQRPRNKGDNPHRRSRRGPRHGLQFTQSVSSTEGELLSVVVRSRRNLRNLMPQPAWRKPARFAAVILGMLLASMVISYFVVKPVRSLRKTTQSLGQHDLSARVEPSVAERNDAIGELGRDFNRMAQRLDDSNKSQHQLLRDVSHELRSPLARIQVANLLAEQKTGESSELKRIDQETQRLDSLIETILHLTRLNDMPNLSMEPLDILPLISEIARNARYEYQNTQKKIEIALGSLPPIEADFEHLSSALENIVRNAMYYTNDPSVVAITAQAHEDIIELCVKDEGPGVPEADLKRLFEPFFRSDTSRNEKTGSNGVGLAICRRIIELHQGQVWAANATPGGLAVTVQLPIKQRLP